MRGVYTHVSQTMRDELSAALQARWEASLRARAELAPRSPIRLLDDLLAPLRIEALEQTGCHAETTRGSGRS